MHLVRFGFRRTNYFLPAPFPQKHLPPGKYILADAAYQGLAGMLTPLPGGGHTDGEKQFCYHQSRLRCKVECAFGRLVARYFTSMLVFTTYLLHFRSYPLYPEFYFASCTLAPELSF